MAVSIWRRKILTEYSLWLGGGGGTGVGTALLVEVMCIGGGFVWQVIKDRVGRSGYDLPRAHATADFSLNIHDRETHNIPKNSHLPYLFGDIIYHYIPQE